MSHLVAYYLTTVALITAAVVQLIARRHRINMDAPIAILILAAMVLHTTSGHAATIYRCGNSYSDSPCAGAKVIELNGRENVLPPADYSLYEAPTMPVLPSAPVLIDNAPKDPFRGFQPYRPEFQVWPQVRFHRRHIY